MCHAGATSLGRGCCGEENLNDGFESDAEGFDSGGSFSDLSAGGPPDFGGHGGGGPGGGGGGGGGGGYGGGAGAGYGNAMGYGVGYTFAAP